MTKAFFAANFFHYKVRKLILFTATQREQMKEEHVKSTVKEDRCLGTTAMKKYLPLFSAKKKNLSKLYCENAFR